MAYRTFEEWNARGRIVKKGEKAMGHLLDGTALFGKEQTKGKKSRDWGEADLVMHQTLGIWVDLRIIINETYPAEEVQTYNLLQILQSHWHPQALHSYDEIPTTVGTA